MSFLSTIIFLFLLQISLDKAFSISDTSFVTLQVLPLHVTIWSSWDVILPIIEPSFNTGEIQATFLPNSFRVDDRKASDSWYITTIQASDLVYNNWIEEIKVSNNNILFKTGPSISLIYWLMNQRVTFWSTVYNTRWNIWTPVVYFKREPGVNSWIIWRYWDMPSIKIIIPPAQTPGNYKWIIYFTLISW